MILVYFVPSSVAPIAQPGLREDHCNHGIKRRGGVGCERVALIAVRIFNICSRPPSPATI